MNTTSALAAKQHFLHAYTTTHSILYKIIDFIALYLVQVYILLVPSFVKNIVATVVPLFHNPVVIGVVLGILLLLPLLKTIFRTFLYFYQKQSLSTNDYIMLQVVFEHDNKETIFATEQLLYNLHNLLESANWKRKWLTPPKTMSLELVSNNSTGIRYLLRVPKTITKLVKSEVLAFLPGANITEVSDYLEAIPSPSSYYKKSFTITFRNHNFLSIKELQDLPQHDPIAYITNHMTKLQEDELVSLAIIISPLSANRPYTKEKNNVLTHIRFGRKITPIIEKRHIFSPLVAFLFVLKFLGASCIRMLEGGIALLQAVDHETYLATKNTMLMSAPLSVEEPLSPYEQEIQSIVKKKLEKPLFEATIRTTFLLQNESDARLRRNGIVSSLGSLKTHMQEFVLKKDALIHLLFSNHTYFLGYENTKRVHRLHVPDETIILSSAELASLYHFPHVLATETEGITKLFSRELPLPISQKQMKTYDVIIGKNTYGGYDGYIKLTGEDRERHILAIGGTGTGKTTMMLYTAIQDIQKGRGVILIDPHGQFATGARACVPPSRMNDLYWLDPRDIKHPMIINLLELPEGLSEDELELAKDTTCDMVITVFRKIFQREQTVSATRIEYILRNAMYTAFTVKDCTLFTVFDLLLKKNFRDKIVVQLDDEELKSFWENEFGKAGDYQQVKMITGVTSKLGRFLLSPIAKRIFGQPHSTLDFDSLMDNGKLLLCNLSKGRIGADNTDLIGTMILAKIQLHALKRELKTDSEKTPMYLYVDEFQTFATQSFIDMLSEIRKYKVYLFIAEQSTTQQAEKRHTATIFGNVATLISFRIGNTEDEQLLLAHFAPYVTKGELMNLPKYHFYIKCSAVSPEAPFSGITIQPEIPNNPRYIEQLTEVARKNYTREYVKPEKKKAISPSTKKTKSSQKKQKKVSDIDSSLT